MDRFVCLFCNYSVFVGQIYLNSQSQFFFCQKSKAKEIKTIRPVLPLLYHLHKISVSLISAKAMNVIDMFWRKTTFVFCEWCLKQDLCLLISQELLNETTRERCNKFWTFCCLISVTISINDTGTVRVVNSPQHVIFATEKKFHSFYLRLWVFGICYVGGYLPAEKFSKTKATEFLL